MGVFDLCLVLWSARVQKMITYQDHVLSNALQCSSALDGKLTHYAQMMFIFFKGFIELFCLIGVFVLCLVLWSARVQKNDHISKSCLVQYSNALDRNLTHLILCTNDV